MAGEIARPCEPASFSATFSAPWDAWTRPVETYRQGLELAAPPGRPALPAAGIAHVGLAAVAYQRGELDAALEHATQGLTLSRQLTYRRPFAAGLATLARVRQAAGIVPAPLRSWTNTGRSYRALD